MKRAIFYLLLFIFLSVCFPPTAESQQTSGRTEPASAAPKQLVLVELYTSEGCGNCPPADRALAYLQKEQPVPEAEIVALALHVDYWNGRGWKDEFSSPLFSQRQEFYDSRFKSGGVYTPQMIVDGSWQFVGSSAGRAFAAITEAAKTRKGTVELAHAADKLIIKIDKLPAHEQATVFLAVAEDNLVSSVGAGANLGKKLEHAAVVRELRPIASIEAAAAFFATETVVSINPAWKKENTRLVVFVQENTSRKIIGVGRIAFD